MVRRKLNENVTVTALRKMKKAIYLFLSSEQSVRPIKLMQSNAIIAPLPPILHSNNSALQSDEAESFVTREAIIRTIRSEMNPSDVADNERKVGRESCIKGIFSHFNSGWH